MTVQKMTVSEEESVFIKSPSDILNMDIRSYLEQQEQENFVVIALDGSHKVTSVRVVSVGTVNQTVIHPREVFRYAIMENASAIIICHNHPSGYIKPSEDDYKTTERLKKASDLLGITLLDHIIIANGNYYSFLENGVVLDNDG